MRRSLFPTRSLSHDSGFACEVREPRRGYTLIELLIVMAVLAAVAGLTLPAIRGPLDKSRLTGAAKQVQAAIAKSRALAIREGAAVQFRYEIRGSRYRIERSSKSMIRPIQVMTAVSEFNTTPSGLAVETSIEAEPDADLLEASSLESSAAAQDASVPAVLREGILPSGVTFMPPLISETLSNPELNPSSSGESETAVQPASVSISSTHWSDPIRFEPSGRMQDRSIHLQGQRGFRVSVVLRGLTGSTSHTAPTRPIMPVGAATTVDAASAKSSRGLP